MQNLSLIQLIAVWALPILFAITLHEAAHGWVASKFGDKTALIMGRVTLNPIKHIDPVGTILVPIILLVLSKQFLGNGLIFGWAKPVPVNWNNLKNPKRDGALVALAGPMSNLLMAFGWALILKAGLALKGQHDFFVALIYMGFAGISINLILMVLNLLPIPPLDGSRIVSTFLPPKAEYAYNRIEPYGFFILIGLIFTGVLFYIIVPPVQFLKALIYGLFGIG